MQALYQAAGLNLSADLQNLTKHANITPDPAAVSSLEQTSVPTGHLSVPELDLHTIGDNLVPVTMENFYAKQVTEAGDRSLLRQAYTSTFGHCNFSPAELAVRARLDELLRPDGLTALQYTALTVLERHPDMSVAQLARNSFVTAQSMADMVAALEDRGLIERHRDQADRRRLAIALSPAGHEFLDRYQDPVNALESRMLHGTTKPQVLPCAAPSPPATPTWPRPAPITVSCAGSPHADAGLAGG